MSGADRRQSFLDAAREIALASGLAAVTMESVAAKIKVNKALGYRYFANRDELLGALFDQDAERFRARLRAEIDPSAPSETKIRQMLTAIMNNSMERGSVLVAAMYDDAKVRERVLAEDQVSIHWLTREIVAQTGAPESAVRRVAAVLTGTISAMVRAAEAGVGSRAEMIEAATFVFVSAIKALSAKT